MNKNILEGTGRDIGGTFKEAAGDVLGRDDLKAEGAGDQLGGKTQKAAGHIQAAIGDSAGPVIDFIKRQPLVAVGIAGALGALLFGANRKR
jgi:uncharacterized protein YjbJ (UPF0337 family)